MDQRGGDQAGSARRLSLEDRRGSSLRYLEQYQGKKSWNEDPLDELRVVDYEDDPLSVASAGRNLARPTDGDFPTHQKKNTENRDRHIASIPSAPWAII